MAVKKSLADHQRDYEEVIFSDQPKRDMLLVGLMAEMERQFKIPEQKNKDWERKNPEIAAMYRKLLITRSL